MGRCVCADGGSGAAGWPPGIHSFPPHAALALQMEKLRLTGPWLRDLRLRFESGLLGSFTGNIRRDYSENRENRMTSKFTN